MIKLVKHDEIEDIKVLHYKIFNEEFPIDDYMEKLKTKVIENYLFFEDDDLSHVVGYSIIFNKKEEKRYHLWLGGILSEYRNKGYCGDFIDEVIKCARDKQYKSVTLYTYNHRPDMIRLAVKKGFRIIKTEEGTYGDGIKIFFQYDINYNEEIRISLTNKCNFKCFFCHQEGINIENKISLDKEQLLRILKQCKINNYRNITLTGGEPLINKDLIELIFKFCKENKYNPNIKIITNGFFIDENFIKVLNLYKHYLKLNISFHSVDEQIFNKITKTNNKYNKVLEGIDLLLLNNINFRLNYLMLKDINDSYEQVKSLVEFGIKKQIKQITFLELLDTKENNIFEKYVKSYNDIKKSIEYVCKDIGHLKVEFENSKKIRYILSKNNKKIILEVFKLTCSIGCKKCLKIKDKSIGPDGKYYPCFLRSDIKYDNVCENMKEVFQQGELIIENISK